MSLRELATDPRSKEHHSSYTVLTTYCQLQFFDYVMFISYFSTAQNTNKMVLRDQCINDTLIKLSLIHICIIPNIRWYETRENAKYMYNNYGLRGFIVSCRNSLTGATRVWKFIPDPVSYTHLDVYKRQELQTVLIMKSLSFI